MNEPFVERRVYEAWGAKHSSGRTATPIGACKHDGCSSQGYDLTDELCSVHFVTDVLAELEDILHEANINWLATCEAESRAKEIWRCQCGYAGTYAERDMHFMANDGSEGHGPPVCDSMVRSTPTRSAGRRRVTTAPNISNIEEIG